VTTTRFVPDPLDSPAVEIRTATGDVTDQVGHVTVSQVIAVVGALESA
jgi:hypothetical protein